MKLYIPDIGDTLTLTKAWTFTLHNEYRNRELYNMGLLDTQAGSSKPMTFNAGTKLIVDRIYIRKGAKDYSSMTFRYGKLRFWAKLHDVNTMEATITIPASSVVSIKWDRFSYFGSGVNDVKSTQDNFQPMLRHAEMAKISQQSTMYNNRDIACYVNDKVKYTCVENLEMWKLRNSYKSSSVVFPTWVACYEPVVTYTIKDEHGNIVGKPYTTQQAMKAKVKKLVEIEYSNHIASAQAKTEEKTK
jgi:hypothetical protein